MIGGQPRRGIREDARAGALAGLLTVAAMEAASALTGVQALPQLLQEPILAVLPGAAFGFLIDSLQHWGKVIEEAGLIAVLVAVLALLGLAAGAVGARQPAARPGLLAAALAWLLVMLVAFPLGGQGPFGTAEGLEPAIVWAVIMAVYAFAWELLRPRLPGARVPGGAGERTADPGRRRVLTLVPAALGLGALALIGALRVPEWARSALAAPEQGLSGPVPALTPIENFYRVSKNFHDPEVAESSWTLRVSGLAGRPLRLTATQLAALPAATETVTLECVSNPVGGELMSTGRFTGVRLRDLVAMAEPRPGAAAVNFRARDGYTESLPLDVVRGEPQILVAYRLDGRPLPRDHGFPARVLIPGRYGMKGPKWLEEIELAASGAGGYWEQQGWDREARVKTTSRFDVPVSGAVLRGGEITLAGVAFAGVRGVRRVEWSVDGGVHWSPAGLEAPLSTLTWTRWRATWRPPREGSYTLAVRAVDGTGALQDGLRAATYPGGAGGYHTIRVDVGR